MPTILMMRVMILTRIIISLFFICCLFPYTPPIMPTDSQPIALAISLLLLPLCLNKRLRMRKDFALFLLMFLFAMGLFVFSVKNSNAIRSLINYLSLFAISFTTYYLLCRNRGIDYRWFKAAVYVWFIVGAVQTFIYPDFLSFLAPRGSAFQHGRGISCLAPEPTFYAIICCCMLIINKLRFNMGGVNLLLWIQIILFARSATIIFIVIASYLLYLLLRKGLRNFIYIGLICCIIYVGIKEIAPFLISYRAGKLLCSLVDNPMMFLVVDESVNERFIHAFFPIYGSLKNYGIPFGFGHFNEYMYEIYNQGGFDDYLLYYRDNYTRIMSGIGSALFELGLVGLILPYVIIKNIAKITRRNTSFLFYGILFFLILLNAMPLSNAIIGFTIGTIIYAASRYEGISEKNFLKDAVENDKRNGHKEFSPN